jgi:NAD-dependent deacetylase
MEELNIRKAAEQIRRSARVTAFTGAGISVESGIPPFRGENGIWEEYDASNLDIRYFLSHPEKSWGVVKEIFYHRFESAQPNAAHVALAQMEAYGFLQTVITQNIDNLHQRAGSRTVIEYHGNSHRLVCLKCGNLYEVDPEILKVMPPRCKQCNTILKPDFVFFGEPIPIKAHQRAIEETRTSDLWLLVGTSGEVYPAASLPFEAKNNHKIIVEVNVHPTNFTRQISDLLLQGKAAEILPKLLEELKNPKSA